MAGARRGLHCTKEANRPAPAVPSRCWYFPTIPVACSDPCPHHRVLMPETARRHRAAMPSFLYFFVQRPSFANAQRTSRALSSLLRGRQNIVPPSPGMAGIVAGLRLERSLAASAAYTRAACPGPRRALPNGAAPHQKISAIPRPQNNTCGEPRQS